MSRALDILNAAYQAVSNPAIAGAVCYRQRGYAAPHDMTAATINVRLGREAPPSLKTGPSLQTGVADRTTELMVVIVARGDDALEKAEELRLEVRRRLQADTTLGGIAIDIEESVAMRDQEDADGDMQRVTQIFNAKYRTIGDET